MSTVARRSARSKQLHQRALARTPGGVHSNVRLHGPKAVIHSAKGAWLYSVDGDDYVDYLLGQGPNFLGHAPDSVVEAVAKACRDGLIYGSQHELEIQAAEAVCEALGWADMVRFGVTGTEAVQAALRLARAATGRTKVIRFEGHYYGWLDNVLLANNGDGRWGTASAGQVRHHLDDFIVLPWNDADCVADALERHGNHVAAVIMEPIVINAGVIEPLPDYLERIRQLCSAHGVILIFDEVISGFRLGLSGAAGRYGVTPDLATYGKAMAGGFAVSALAGRADLMSRFGTGEVNHSGTFNGAVPAMAATVATLARLRDAPPYDSIAEHGHALMAGVRHLGETHGVPLRVAGLPAAFHVSIGDGAVTDHRSLSKLNLAQYAQFAAVIVEHRVWVADRGIWYVSAAHGQSELDVALTRFDEALTDWLAR